MIQRREIRKKNVQTVYLLISTDHKIHLKERENLENKNWQTLK